MAAKISTVTLNNVPLAGHSERGGFGVQLHKLVYAAGEGDTLLLPIDTIDLGAGSVAFHVNNIGSQDAVVKLYVHNGDVADKLEIPFKDYQGTETVVGGLTISAAGKKTIIVTYASYPEAMAMRFIVLEFNPTGNMSAAVEIPIYVAVK